MRNGAWWGVAALVGFLGAAGAFIATRPPIDHGAPVQRYLERGWGERFRVTDVKRDSHLHDGFPDQYEVTCIRVGDDEADRGEPVRVTLRYADGAMTISDGGYCWSSGYAVGENAAFQAAAGALLDRPLTRITFTPRTRFASTAEIEAWGPFAQDPEIAYAIELVVFGSAAQDGARAEQLLAEWLPRWAGARTVRARVAFCGDRRDDIDAPYKGTHWQQWTDTLWVMEFPGTALGGCDAATIRAAREVRFPRKELEAEQAGESK